MSGGTVLANISYLDLSLSALAVEAGEIWGIRNKRRRLATWKVKVRKLSFFSSDQVDLSSRKLGTEFWYESDKETQYKTASLDF